MRRARAMSIVSACFAALPALANAQTYDSGSTGVDGALTLPAGTCVGLTCTIPLPPSGEFNYTTVTIPGGYTLKFARNATNTPVVIRASGNVTITGNIDVSGTPGGSAAQSTPLGNNAGLAGIPISGVSLELTRLLVTASSISRPANTSRAISSASRRS